MASGVGKKPRPPRKTPDPTGDLWGAYARAFDFFNEALFQGRLGRCILNFSRHSGSLGFYIHHRWESSSGGARVSEISLNPDLLKEHIDVIMSTLVHEMTHLEQHLFGTPGKGGYHNNEWMGLMSRVGLIPRGVDRDGRYTGFGTGFRVTHTVDPAGPFAAALRRMPKKARLPWLSAAPQGAAAPRRNRGKANYRCPKCGFNAWAASGDGMTHTRCRVAMVERGA